MEQKQELSRPQTRVEQKIAEELREFKINMFNYLFDQYLGHTMTLQEATQTFQEVMTDALDQPRTDY